VGALNRAGYQGYYDIELIGEAVESRDYLELLDRSKRAFEGLIAH
jgi:hypothetical protein